MLSRDCDGCSTLFTCKQRFGKVVKGEKVFCPDGTVHLVDSDQKVDGAPFTDGGHD